MNQFIFKPLLIAIAILFISACKTDQNQSSQSFEIIGVKIYEHSGDYEILFEEWKEIGINAVFCSKDMFSDKEFRSFTKKYGIASFIISPVFFNPEELQADSNLYAMTEDGSKAKDDWVEFICPSRVDYRQRIVRNIGEMVRDLDPDGISIDFIRHFVFWETVFPDIRYEDLPKTCFDSSCLNHFQNHTGIKIPESVCSTEDIAKWIQKNHLEEWVNWKCELISNMVKEIVNEVRKVKPNIKTNVHIVPWREADYNDAIRKIAGQDVSKLALYTDYLSPMTYSHMVKRDPTWVHSVVNDIYRQSGSKILPSIQVKEAYLNDTLGLEEFKMNLMEALKPPSKGVVFWSWEQLEKDPDKKEVIKAVLGINKYQ